LLRGDVDYRSFSKIAPLLVLSSINSIVDRPLRIDGQPYMFGDAATKFTCKQ